MTTNLDNLLNRLESLGTGREFTTGVPIDGAVDPTGEYPKKSYHFKTSINNAALGIKVNNITYGGSGFDMSFESTPQKGSIFPFSQVQETPSGHSFEIDDTPGGERILIKHRTGAGVELKPDGTVIVSSRNNQIQVSGGDHKVVIEGNGEMHYHGDLNMNVTGDYNLKVGGDYNLDVGTNSKQRYGGSLIREIVKREKNIIMGSRDTRVYGRDFSLNMDNVTEVVKGDYLYLGDGSVQVSVNNDYTLSTKENFYVSSGNVGIVSDTGQYTFRSGIVGGEDVKHFGKAYTGPADGTGTQTTFYGTLVGKATEAYAAEFSQKSVRATWAANADHAYRAAYATKAKDALKAVTAQDGPAADPFTMQGTEGTDEGIPDYTVTLSHVYHWDGDDADGMPIGKTIGTYLQTNKFGIKDIVIDFDPNDPVDPLDPPLIQKKLHRSSDYMGIFNRDPSLEEIRSRLRSFDLPNGALTEEQEKCLDVLRVEGRLSTKFKDPFGSELGISIGRTEDYTPTPKFSYNLLGNPPELRSKRIVAPDRRAGQGSGNTKRFLPDPKYNPDVRRGRLRLNTKLAQGVTLGKFFGATGDPTSLTNYGNTADNAKIARQLYLHANLLSMAREHPEFKDHRIVVSEGVYKQLPDEPDPFSESVNEYKIKGEAVVYNVLNNRGKIDFQKTFDLAVYWKDFALYDKLILDYDLYHPKNQFYAGIVMIMPTIGPDYNGQFKLKVETHFNRWIYSQYDLIEMIPDSPEWVVQFNPIA